MYQETNDSQDMYTAENKGQPQSPSDPNVNTVTDHKLATLNQARTRPAEALDKGKQNATETLQLSTSLTHPTTSSHSIRGTRQASHHTHHRKTTVGDPPTSPANSTIPVTTTSSNNITSGPALQSQDEINMVYIGDNEAEQSNDDNERHLDTPRALIHYASSTSQKTQNNFAFTKNFSKNLITYILYFHLLNSNC